MYRSEHAFSGPGGGVPASAAGNTGARSGNGDGDPYAMLHPPRALISLPPLSALSANNVASYQGNTAFTRRSKSSSHSDESFSAYLHHFPSSSSPALDRVLDARYSATRSGIQQPHEHATDATVHAQHSYRRQRLSSLDAVGYAQERAAPSGRPAQTPQRLSLRDVLAMHEQDRNATRLSGRDPSTPWRDTDEARQRQHDLTYTYASSAYDVQSKSERDVSSSSPQEQADANDSFDPSLVSECDAEGDDDDEEEDGDGETKRRRRRTNKNEVSVLAAVFEKSAFPDVMTREALAQRLGMSFRSVSIWFQNRRQAMKKRASRFGGIDGVRGATVTSFACMDRSTSSPEVIESKAATGDGTSQDREKRWLSLDEVASRAKGPESLGNEIVVRVDQMINKTSKPCAPLLEMLRKRRGEHSFSRIASMPCIAAVLESQETKENTHPSSLVNSLSASTKDLRHVLDDIATVRTRKDTVKGNSLIRSASMTALPRLAEQVQEKSSLLVRAPSVDLSLTNQDSTQKAAPSSNVLESLKAVDSALQAPVASEREIWKRMHSSSSGLSSTTNTPESDKENRNPQGVDEDDEAFEDEEKTLRRIATKRMEKREQKLSTEGQKYVEQADARLALQRKRSDSVAADDLRKPLRVLDSIAPITGRTLSQSRINLGRSSLARVTSLDFEAGRDRSAGALPLRPVISFQSLTGRARLQRYKSRPSNESASSLDRSLKKRKGGKAASQKPFNRALSASHAPSGRQGRLAPTASMPLTSKAANSDAYVLQEDRADDLGSDGSLIVSQSRHSQAGRQSSEGSSEEWTEGWTRDHAIPRSRTLDGNTAEMRKRKSLESAAQGREEQPAKSAAYLHDDSGFFGSDVDSDNEQDENSFVVDASGRARSSLVKKRRLDHATGQDRQPLRTLQSSSLDSPYKTRRPLAAAAPSSSPFKRGDERDRLAAETLLAFGSHAD